MTIGPRKTSTKQKQSSTQNSQPNSGWGQKNQREGENLKLKIKWSKKKRKLIELRKDVENKGIISSDVKAKLQGAQPRRLSDKIAVRARRGGEQPG